jgi:hypothetical protein
MNGYDYFVVGIIEDEKAKQILEDGLIKILEKGRIQEKNEACQFLAYLPSKKVIQALYNATRNPNIRETAQIALEECRNRLKNKPQKEKPVRGMLNHFS